ncbi:MAG: thioredoxin [Anaerolineales bacterium]|jgi:thioredoxin 1
MADILTVSDGTFQAEVLNSELPVLVDFGAEWCHPCRMLDPIVDELASEWEGKVKVVKVDIDVNVETAMQYGVMGVPTLMVFVQGEPKGRHVGFAPKSKILRKLASPLGL